MHFEFAYFCFVLCRFFFAGVLRVLGRGLNQSAWIFFYQSFLWLLRHTDEPQRGRKSCLWLQSRSVLRSFDVVLMSLELIFTQYDQHCSILLAEFNMSTVSTFITLPQFPHKPQSIPEKNLHPFSDQKGKKPNPWGRHIPIWLI